MSVGSVSAGGSSGPVNHGCDDDGLVVGTHSSGSRAAARGSRGCEDEEDEDEAGYVAYERHASRRSNPCHAWPRACPIF